MVVVLSGGLSGCAPAPAPPPQHARTRAWSDPSDEPHDPGCGGGDRGNELTPEERRAKLAKAIERETSRCGSEVEAAGRHGEAWVTIRGNAAGELTVRVTADPGLTIEDQRCVEAVARSVAQLGDAYGHDLARDLEVDLAFGTWPPLFPPAGKLTKEWVAAMHTKAARKRFVAKLPTEVVLGEDGCLSIPRRRALSDGLDRWLESIESPVGEIWQSSANDWSKHGLLDEIGPSGGRRVRAYWLGGRAVLLHRGVVADPLWQEICLIPLDETLRQKIRFAIDDRGTCWVGDLDEIVLHPRAEFPTDRRFKAVADGATHACALDDAGTPVCCGE
jgi:hypothetical protein